MGDLINRQDAIDALNGNITVTGEANAKAVQEYIRSVALKIKDLPSAQPEKRTENTRKTHGVFLDVISRQAAIDAVKENTFRLTFAEEQNYEGHVAWSAYAVYSDVIEGALLELPSAQPERPKGEWVGVHAYCDHKNEEAKVNGKSERYLPSGMVSGVYCNQCWYRADKKSDFCPNCWADMREEERDYERGIEQVQHDMLYEPSYSPEDGSM